MRSIIICLDCGEEKPLKAKGRCNRCYGRLRYKYPTRQRWFAENRDKTRGFVNKCAASHREQNRARQRQRRIDHPDEARAEQYKCKYGITIPEYEHILALQGGICAICGGVNASGRRLSVDHNHVTGFIRGLLCDACNTALGKWVESGWTFKAQAYLEKEKVLC